MADGKAHDEPYYYNYNYYEPTPGERCQFQPKSPAETASPRTWHSGRFKRRKQVRVSLRPILSDCSSFLRRRANAFDKLDRLAAYLLVLRVIFSIILGGRLLKGLETASINRTPLRAGSVARTTKPPSRNARAGPSSGPLRVRQSSSALLITPEPELDDNRNITTMQSGPGSVVVRECSGLSKASS